MNRASFTRIKTKVPCLVIGYKAGHLEGKFDPSRRHSRHCSANGSMSGVTWRVALKQLERRAMHSANAASVSCRREQPPFRERCPLSCALPPPAPTYG
jgi:hypothetical protein